MPKGAYEDIAEASRDINDYTWGYYQTVRSHSFNSYLSPAEKERHYFNRNLLSLIRCLKLVDHHTCNNVKKWMVKELGCGDQVTLVVISVSGIDSRVKVAVSQVPTILGYKAKQEILTKEELPKRFQRFTQAWLNREHSIDTEIIKTVSKNDQPCAYSDFYSYSYMTKQAERCPNWRNFTTVTSLDLAQIYEPRS